ncbi:odorant receptor 10-like isoform X2 [Prorops nasuta]
MIFMFLPETIMIMRNFKDIDLITAILPLFCGSIMGFSKAIVLFSNVNEVKILLEELQKDWRNFSLIESELLLIKNYAKRGKQITVMYAGSIYAGGTCFYLMSLAAPVADLIKPLNESRHRVFLYPGDFYVPNDNHFLLILTMEWYGLMCAGHVILTLDTFYITLLLHSCGTFAVLSQRLEKLEITNFQINKDQLFQENSNIAQDKKVYFYLTECIKLHLRNIRFTERLNSTFSKAFFIDLSFGVLVASASAVKFVLSINEPNQRIMYGGIYLMQSIRIFCNSLPGQLLINHSNRVKLAAYQSKWYELPERSKKLLLILMMRSEKPNEFVVGKLFAMNIQLFSVINRTCFSYCTALLSLQKN